MYSSLLIGFLSLVLFGAPRAAQPQVPLAQIETDRCSDPSLMQRPEKGFRVPRSEQPVPSSV